MEWMLYFILAGVLLVGLYINLFGAPGLWIMVLATLGYAWGTQWRHAGWKTSIVIIVLAGIAEVFDFVSSGAAAKRAGASRRGVIGALLGCIIGALFLSVPLPIIGTIIGMCIGTFAGAFVGELTVGREISGSVRVGFGAVIGRIFGTLTKLFFGCLMLGIVLIAALPLGPGKKTTIPPMLQRSTTPLPPATQH